MVKTVSIIMIKQDLDFC